MNQETTKLMLSIFTGLTLMGCNTYVTVTDPKLDTDVRQVSADVDGELESSKPIQWIEFQRTAGYMPAEHARLYNARLRIDLRGGKPIGKLDDAVCPGSFEPNVKLTDELSSALANAAITTSNQQAIDAGNQHVTFEREDGRVVDAYLGVSDGSFGNQAIEDADGKIRRALHQIISDRQSTCGPAKQELKVVRLKRTSSLRNDTRAYPVNRKFEQLSAEVVLDGEGISISAKVESRDIKTGETCSENIFHQLRDPGLVRKARAMFVEQNIYSCLMMARLPDSVVVHGPLLMSLKDTAGTITEWAGFGCEHASQARDPFGFMPALNKVLIEKQKCLANPLQIENQ